MKINLEYAITQLVESMLPRFSEGKILQINLQARYSLHLNNEEPQEERANIIFLFERKGNYTKVLLEWREEPFNMRDVDTWYMTADHDSCWNSDGVDRELSKIERKLKERFSEEDLKIGRIHEYVYFDIIKPKVFDGEMKRVNEHDYRERNYKVILTKAG